MKLIGLLNTNNFLKHLNKQDRINYIKNNFLHLDLYSIKNLENRIQNDTTNTNNKDLLKIYQKQKNLIKHTKKKCQLSIENEQNIQFKIEIDVDDSILEKYLKLKKTNKNFKDYAKETLFSLFITNPIGYLIEKNMNLIKENKLKDVEDTKKWIIILQNFQYKILVNEKQKYETNLDLN